MKIKASSYPDPGSRVYAIVDDDEKIMRDSIDGSVCVFVTRATAEYQMMRNGHRFYTPKETP